MKIVLLRPGTKPHPYVAGATVPDPAAPRRSELCGLVFTPSGASQGTDGIPVTETATLGQLPAGLLHENDEVEVDGARYRVTGVTPSPSNPFTGWEPGGTANLERIR